MNSDVLISQKDFFQKYNISPADFKKTRLDWDDLREIHDHYCEERAQLEIDAAGVLGRLSKIPDVHSVRYRIKHPESVIRKIIDKKIKEPNLDISVGNYQQILTDLIGLRALHLFKEQSYAIHQGIIDNWEPVEKPIVYYRFGDAETYWKDFEALGCTAREHPNHYRSIHYTIPLQATKKRYLGEIQVRTIFEEGWSEIDHLYNYPLKTENKILADFLQILNKLAGSADEMGTFIQSLNTELIMQEEAKDLTIKSLIADIQELKLKDAASKSIIERLEKLNANRSDWVSDVVQHTPLVIGDGLIYDETQDIIPHLPPKRSSKPDWMNAPIPSLNILD